MNGIFTTNRPLFVAVIMSTLLVGLVGFIFIGSFIMFHRRSNRFTSKLVNKFVFGCFTATWVTNVILTIFLWLFSINVFSVATQVNVIIFTVFNFALILVISLMLVIRLEHIVIGIDHREIAFLGERILLRNVLEISEDDAKNLFILKYKEGRNRTKKLKFKKNTIAGQFLFQNKELITEFNDREGVSFDEPKNTTDDNIVKSKEEASFNKNTTDDNVVKSDKPADEAIDKK